MSEHQHDWQKTGVAVTISSHDDGAEFRGDCNTCDWSFGHQDKDAVRKQACAHLEDPQAHP